MCVMDENNGQITDLTDANNSFNKYDTSVADNILNKHNLTGDANFTKYMPESVIHFLTDYF